MNAYELKDKLNEFYPFCVIDEIAKSGYVDNSGVIVEGESDKICFTLDLTDGAIDYALEKGCALIVTHHPVIFTSVKSVKGVLARAIKNGIGIISMHLPADYAPKGVDYYLAEALGAKNAEVLEKMKNGSAYGRLFEIERSTLSDFAEMVYEKLSCVNLSVFGENKSLKKVASLSLTRGEMPTQYKALFPRLFVSIFLTIHSSSRMIVRIPGANLTILTLLESLLK